MRIISFISLLLMSVSHTYSSVEYSISFPNPADHYAEITMSVEAGENEAVRVKMPVWTPGSYKVREFSQHVDETWYESEGQRIKPTRIDKNTWECVSQGKSRIAFTYRLYAFELGVRTSYVDQHMAFLHGPSAFMYFEGREDEPITILFNPLKSWKNIEMALPQIPEYKRFMCANYDLLADSPVALGNFDISTYETAGVPHKIVMIGEGNYDLDKVTSDFKKITDEEVKMFNNEHPCEQYIHFIQNVDNGGGGLEHLNCQTSQMLRWNYADENRYRSFLGLISHEYFHLWNVKRIRPIELGPFDYNTENYTELLWVAEGVTSYYDDLFLKRAGIHSEDSYLKELAANINRLENQPGKDVMNLCESSKLAWVKAYMGNENSNNVTISYYNKGMLVAWMLDMEIMGNTNNEKRLDDVMRQLYDKYYIKKKRGFTYSEFVIECSNVCGKPMDDFFNIYTRSTRKLPYYQYLGGKGLSLEDRTSKSPSLGIKTKVENGKTIVAYVSPAGAGLESGLSVNDEIISLNGWRVDGEINSKINGFEIGSPIELIYARSGKIYTTTIIPKKNTEVNYSIVPLEDASEELLEFKEIWLN